MSYTVMPSSILLTVNSVQMNTRLKWGFRLYFLLKVPNSSCTVQIGCVSCLSALNSIYKISCLPSSSIFTQSSSPCRTSDISNAVKPFSRRITLKSQNHVQLLQDHFSSTLTYFSATEWVHRTKSQPRESYDPRSVSLHQSHHLYPKAAHLTGHKYFLT